MNHQGELEKKKYRNWVRGVLAYKYLKEGLLGFADDMVQQEHTRIISAVSHTPGLICTKCCLRNLRPIHKCERDPVTGENKCYWGQSNCNCLYTKKRPCHLKVCDRILEDVLKSHGSTPPTPNWKNTDTQKWCTDPWEIAKCFINAPGYSDKTKAADIDTPGLLHVFINNTNLQSHFTDTINGSDIFKQVLQRRNELFHSPTMEMEGTKLDECIDEIIAILEDKKELNARPDAQQAVFKLKQLKQENFIITTHNEAEACRDALAYITNKSEELKHTIQDAKDDICRKQKEVAGTIQDAKYDICEKQKEVTCAIQDAKDDICEKQKEVTGAIQDAKDDICEKQKEVTGTIQDVEDDICEKQKEVIGAIQDAKNDICQRQKEVIRAIQDAKDDICKKQTKVTNAIEEQAKKALQELDKHSVLERVERLEVDSSFSKQRITLLESKIKEIEIIRQNHQRQLDYVERKQALQKQLVTMYQNHYVRTSISPLKLHENNINIMEVYVAPEMVMEDNNDENSPNPIVNAQNKSNIRNAHKYRDILQTNGQKHKTVYIVGDVGTGKSAFCKTMIQNWCSAVTEDNPNDKSEDCRKTVFDLQFSTVYDENINEMRNFDFLFFVPLQRMPGIGDITAMIKAIITAADFASTDLIDRIFQQDSER